MKMTQAERILRHMEDYGSITSIEAVSEYGITQLAARLCDLKALGFKFTKERETGKNRYGEPTHWTRYRLEVRQ